MGAEQCDQPGGGGFDIPGIIGTIGGWFGGGGGGGGGGPTSNALRDPGWRPPVPAPAPLPFPRQALAAYGAWSSASLAITSWGFHQTGVGQFASAYLNPVQNKTEYIAGMGEGVLTGALGPFTHAGNALGYGPRQLFLVGGTADANQGFGDGMGIVGAAFGVAEVSGALEQLGAGLSTAVEGLGGMGGGGGRSITVTEEMIRNVMKDAPLVSQQAGGVSLPRVQAYVNRLLAGEAAPAIKVDGKMIVDGNHRYIAGRIFGREPPIQSWVGGRPERAVPWSEILVHPEAW